MTDAAARCAARISSALATRRQARAGEVARVEAARVAPEHGELGLARREVDDELEQEPVELRLGQRVGALVLDRVLRRGDEERVGERPGHAVGRDLALLHRLEQRRLRLGRRAVDLVGEHDVREDRALAELELARCARRRRAIPRRRPA